MRVRLRPVEFDAEQFDGTTLPATAEAWTTFRGCPHGDGEKPGEGPRHALFRSLDGFVVACPGDFVVEGADGDRHVCKPDNFPKVYDVVQ